MPTERNRLIYSVRINSKGVAHVIDTINLKEILPGNAEIEGSFILDNFIFLADEENRKIFCFNLQSMKSKPIKINGIDISEFTSKHGMEGISVDVDSQIVYLLREKNPKNRSEIHSFKLVDTGSNFELNWIDSISTKLEISFRYCDLYFDKETNSIFLLKTSFDRSGADNNYLIEKMSLTPGPSFYKDWDSKLVVDFSDKVNKKEYNSNIEGLVKIDDFFFVVSDNRKEENQKQKKTAFIKIKGN